jgi:catechol O-methyltransferase
MPPWHREVRGDYMTLILGLSKPHGIYLSVNYRVTDSRTAQPHAYTHLHSPLMTLKQVQRIPFLHWSFLRTATRIWNVPRTGQFGDGREAAAVEYVLQNAQAGDLDDVLAAIGRFAHEKAFLVNIGDEKGALLDAAVQRANPKLALELGTYCGYSALRIARAAPAAKVYSVEKAAANADNARRIWAHAGVADRVTCVVGAIGDRGRTLDTLANEHAFDSGTLDFVFLDHFKLAYVPDLRSILGRGWLHAGSIVVADNCGWPPQYRKYMHQQRGRWNTVEHETHLEEYLPSIPDLVLESEYLG